MKKNYEEIEQILKNPLPSEKIYCTTYRKEFTVTANVYEFFTQCDAFWLGDAVASYFYNITKAMITHDDFFFILTVDVKKDNSGVLRIQRESQDNSKLLRVITQKIGYIDLPMGIYKFYLIGSLDFTGKIISLRLLTPTEY